MTTTNLRSWGGRKAFVRGGDGQADATRTYASMRSAVVGEGGSVADKGNCLWLGGGGGNAVLIFFRPSRDG